MLIEKILWHYDDITVVPKAVSKVNSRKTLNPYYRGYGSKRRNVLPIFASPMAAVVNKENMKCFWEHNVIPILPRTFDISERLEKAKEEEWIAVSLDEFVEYFTKPNDFIDSIDKPTTLYVLIDIAQGDMLQTIDFINKAREFESMLKDKKFVIMVGNIAEPEYISYILYNHVDIDYIRLCREESTSDYKKYPLLKNPKISAIMPIYNGGKYLYYSLRSIQNQEMKDIEIILVDDCSTDNSLSIIANYMKEDKRIRLIKNQYNRKILYSKSIAALNANGKFIIELDQDDMFIRNDVFDMLFYEAENNNLDLVHIRDFIKRDFTFKKVTNVNLPFIHLVFPREMHYKQQPELTQRNFVDNNNYLLWGLLIKSDLYKKAIYKLWPIIMNYQMIFHEDYTISFMIVILSKRYKYLNNFALVHLSHSKAASEKYLENDNYYLGIFFFASTLYNYYLKYHENEIYILLNYVNLFMVEFKKGKSKFHDLFKYIIKLILNSRFLGDNEKNDLIKRLDLNKYYYKTNKIYEYLMTQPEFDRLCLFQNKQINRIEGFKISVQNPIFSIIIFCSEYTYLKKTINSIENQFLRKI